MTEFSERSRTADAEIVRERDGPLPRVKDAEWRARARLA